MKIINKYSFTHFFLIIILLLVGIQLTNVAVNLQDDIEVLDPVECSQKKKRKQTGQQGKFLCIRIIFYMLYNFISLYYPSSFFLSQ